MEPLATNQGRSATAHPGLWIARFDKPQPLKRVGAEMVTFAVILQGEKRVEFGAATLRYDEGSYLFVTGEQQYLATVPRASRARPYLSIALLLAPELITEAVFSLNDAGVHFDASDSEDRPAFVERLSRPLLSPLLRIVECLEDPVSLKVLAPLAERELVVQLLRQPSGGILRTAVGADDGRIRRAVSYLQRNFEKRLTVDTLARRAAMSPSHFAHRFRAVVRMSPMQYVKHLRLQRARTLMLRDGLRPSEVAPQVGYASTSHFTRDFKARFGTPPATYVRELGVG